MPLQGIAPSWHPLNWIDEYLLSRGWTHNGKGWVAPESMQAAIQIRYGGGSGPRSRAHAAALQISADEHFSFNSDESEVM